MSQPDPQMVNIPADPVNCLKILGKVFEVKDNSPELSEDYHLEVEVFGQTFTGCHYYHDEALKQLADRVQKYLEPLREADLRRLAAWNNHEPIRA